MRLRVGIEIKWHSKCNRVYMSSYVMPLEIFFLTLQVFFHMRSINYRAHLQKITYIDKATYGSSPPSVPLETYACRCMYTSSCVACRYMYTLSYVACRCMYTSSCLMPLERCISRYAAYVMCYASRHMIVIWYASHLMSHDRHVLCLLRYSS